MTEDDLPPPPQNSGHTSLAPPPVVTSQAELNWPIKNLGESFFDRALAAGSAEGMTGGGGGEGAANGEALDAWAADAQLEGENEPEEDEDEGWDLDAEVIEEPEADVEEEAAEVEQADLSEGVTAGVPEDDHWVRNSPLAADHAAAGSFETAMQLLNRQVGAVNFAPLKPLFLSSYQSSHVYVAANPNLPPLAYNVRRNPDSTDLREILPAISFNFDDIKAGELTEAYRFFSRGKFVESLTLFRTILQKLLLVVVTDDSQVAEVRSHGLKRAFAN